MLARQPDDARARLFLAEGLLCRGLEHDDPWALAAALDGLQARLSNHPADFFARLYLAEGLRRRYPLAGETETAFTRVRQMLGGADVGAARPALETHLRESDAALRAYRAQFAPLLRERQAALARRRLSTPELIDLLTLLPQTGPSGADRARTILDERLAREPSVALDTFYRAEILRGVEPPVALARRYRAAAAALCADPGAQINDECHRARWRLEQLEPDAGANKGG